MSCSKKLSVQLWCIYCTLVFLMFPSFLLQVTNPPIDPIREKIVMSLVRQWYFVIQTSLHVVICSYIQFDEVNNKERLGFCGCQWC